MFGFLTSTASKSDVIADRESFRILQITSYSDHPVRNSTADLIFGDHVLWEPGNANVDDRGSLAPNVFSYDFATPLALHSMLNVTIKVINRELFGKDCVLVGLLNGSTVFESYPCTISSEEVTVAVCIVKPHSTSKPASLNGDFSWVIVPKEVNQSQEKLEYACRDKTRLELYWVSTDIHEVFLGGLSGIDIQFLRCVIPSLNFDAEIDISDPESHTAAFGVPWPEAGNVIFWKCSKIYDTVYGYPRFGVTGEGGKFQYRYYTSSTPGGAYGSFQPYVNCYDQAAMFEVTASFRITQRPSWLLLNPTGFIKPTRLVGVPGLCNNPFYRKNGSPQFLQDINDKRRTSFGNHVFNGAWSQWSKSNWYRDRIYDTCHGPHLGSASPVLYLNATVDYKTKLYNKLRPPYNRAGFAGDIKKCKGVTSTVWRLTSSDDMKISEATRELLRKCAVGNLNASSRSQAHWDDVPQWTKAVLGEGYNVGYQEISIGDGVAESFWHLTGAAGISDDIIVRVRAQTRIGEDGNLDHEASARAALDELTCKLHDHQLNCGPNQEDIEILWAPAPFEDHAQYAVQQAAGIPHGRILIASGNFMIDISGGSSSAALAPMARRLLMHTTIEAPFTLHIPAITHYSYETPEVIRGTFKEVKGIASSFNVKCDVDGIISSASADVEGFGLLLSKYNIESDEDRKTSMVTFTFVTRSTGTHDVNLRLVEALTMITSSERIQVTVVEA